MQQQQKPMQQQQPQKPMQPLSWPAPPIYVMKQMDTLLFQHGQSIDEIKNRLNCIETGSGSEFVSGTNEVVEEFSKSALMSDPEFVNGIVDNIMTNSNLADIIEQIDAVQSENQELRELFYAQQKTINEMNLMMLKLFSQSVAAPSAPNPVAVPVAAVPVAVPIAVPIAVPVAAEVAAVPVAAVPVAAEVAAVPVAAEVAAVPVAVPIAVPIAVPVAAEVAAVPIAVPVAAEVAAVPVAAEVAAVPVAVPVAADSAAESGEVAVEVAVEVAAESAVAVEAEEEEEENVYQEVVEVVANA
jgi:hypothetical protein